MWITGLFLLFFHAGVGQVLLHNTSSTAKESMDSLPQSASFLGDTSVTKKEIAISKEALDVPIVYEAKDSVVFDVRNKRVYLYGEAKVEYGEMKLGAAFMVINFETRELFATGRVDSAGKYVDLPVFKDKDREVGADSMKYNFLTKKGKMQGLALQEGEGYILCNRVFRDSTGEIYTDVGKYTTCNHPDPHFYLNARKLKIIPNKKIIFGPSNIVVEEVPLPAIIPFGIFPTKKGQTSGVIIPQPGNSAARGFNFTQGGYYFHLSDYVDQAIVGDFYFRGSWGLQSNTRYAKRYKYNGGVNLGYAKNIFGEKDEPGYRISPDYKIRWTHAQDAKAKPGTGFNADVDVVSNQYNRNNSFNPNQIVASQFRSTISYSKMMGAGKYNLRMGMNHNQNTQTREFNVDLPTINFDVNRFNPLKSKKRIGQPRWYETIGMSYSTNFTNRLNTYDSLLTSPDVLQGFKNGISHAIPISTSFKFLKNYFTINPQLTYNAYTYFETIEKEYDPISREVVVTTIPGMRWANDYSFSTSMNTRIFGTFKFKRNPKIEAIRHVLTPSINLNLRPDFSAARFDYYRTIQVDSIGTEQRYSVFEQGIKGGPGLGRQGLIGFSLINNLEMKKVIKTDTSSDFKYIKLIENLDVNGNYNMLADSFKLSNIRMGLRTVLFKQLSIQLNSELDMYARENGRRVDRLQFQENGGLGRFTNAGFITSYAFNPKTFENLKGRPMAMPNANQTDQEWRNVALYPHNYIDFKVPWNLNLNYSLRYTERPGKSDIQNILNFSGDVSLSENWKVALTSGYDFANKQLSYTSVDFIRDLHCWQFNFNWIPFGERKSYFFILRAKSSLLQDLKLNKRGFWFDN